MTKQEALKALAEGKKIRHRYFSDDEYIVEQNYNLIDEKGYLMRDFWKYRTTEDWDTGWEIVK